MFQRALEDFAVMTRKKIAAGSSISLRALVHSQIFHIGGGHGLRGIEEFLRRIDSDELAGIQHRDSGAEQKRFAHMVGHNHDRLPEVLLHFLEFALDFGARERIERSERFVHQQNGWVGGERSGDPDALALPAGKLMGIAARIFTAIESYEFEQMRDARTNSLFRPALQAREQRNILLRRCNAERAPRPE